MAGKVKFKLNYAGVKQLLNSKEMKTILNEHAQQVMGSLPSGYETAEGDTGQRAKVRIYPATAAAYRDTLKNNTLLKAIGK